jgi:hypothetical protein
VGRAYQGNHQVYITCYLSGLSKVKVEAYNESDQFVWDTSRTTGPMGYTCVVLFLKKRGGKYCLLVL